MIDTTKTPRSKEFSESPMLTPGNHQVKILRIKLSNGTFGKQITLYLETPPIGGNFKGFQIDSKDPSKGNYQGKTAYVDFSRYNFRDNEEKGIIAEEELQIAIDRLCNALGLSEWYLAQNAKHETMEHLILAMDKEKPFADIYFHCCIGGREYMSGQYKRYNLYFIKGNRERGYGFGLDESKVAKFYHSEDVITLADQQKSKSSKTGEKQSDEKPAETPFPEEEEEGMSLSSDTPIHTGDEEKKYPWDKKGNSSQDNKNKEKKTAPWNLD